MNPVLATRLAGAEVNRPPDVDHIALVSGGMSRALDDGEPVALKPFYAVVQRGVGHSWLNTGREPALLMCVMVGGQ